VLEHFQIRESDRYLVFELMNRIAGSFFVRKSAQSRRLPFMIAYVLYNPCLEGSIDFRPLFMVREHELDAHTKTTCLRCRLFGVLS